MHCRGSEQHGAFCPLMVSVAALPQNHLQHEFAKLRTLNSLSVSVVNCGDYWEADTTSRVFRIAEHAVEKEWSMPPLHVRLVRAPAVGNSECFLTARSGPATNGGRRKERCLEALGKLPGLPPPSSALACMDSDCLSVHAVHQGGRDHADGRHP